MADEGIHDHINRLVEEEKSLRAGGVGGTDPARLQQVETELDQCWDLLRQRDARREFGENPDDAQVRPAAEVENYLD